MRTERNSAIRLLQLLMVASLLFPAALFVYAAWNDYREVYAVADERIDRSLDVLQEQGLKVFETVDRIFSGSRRGRARHAGRTDPRRGVEPHAAPATHRRRDAASAVDHSDRPRRPPAGLERARRAERRRLRRSRILQGAARRRAGTYVGDLRTPTGPAAGVDLFDISQRLASSDGTFRGIIAIAVRTRYFDDFYAMIEQSPGNFYALSRDDGCCWRAIRPRCSRRSSSAPSGAAHADRQRSYTRLYSVTSEVDGVTGGWASANCRVIRFTPSPVSARRHHWRVAPIIGGH